MHGFCIQTVATLTQWTLHPFLCFDRFGATPHEFLIHKDWEAVADRCHGPMKTRYCLQELFLLKAGTIITQQKASVEFTLC